MTEETFPLSQDTLLVHGGTVRSQHGETSEAIYMTSGFTYKSAESAEARFKGEEEGFVYSRYANPTVAMFEKRMALLEGAEGARATGSGMAAVAAALISQVKAGDHIVAARALFSSCRYIIEDLLPRFGVESTLVDGCDLDQWRAAMRPNTVLTFLESPTNPMLDVIDIEAVADITRKGGARLVVDNVFATPLVQRPLKLGASIVVYSATKHIDGQGRCLGGVILSDQETLDGALKDYLRHTGPAISPFNAWLLLKGLETLPLRTERHAATAAALADHLAGHAKVSNVRYPGRSDHPQHALAKKQMTNGGPMVAFDINGGKTAAFTFLNALQTIRISNNLGDAKSLITHPATTTHQRMEESERELLGITGSTVRISCGLESVGDLVADIDRALARV
ncbi:MAG: O-succinylhomoserine sulfhydrylase [Rhodobiaceae bacterium]|nr:O-succinylhomoserine sulfhydrylase [Rhodobiaceae bacterium]